VFQKLTAADRTSLTRSLRANALEKIALLSTKPLKSGKPDLSRLYDTYPSRRHQKRNGSVKASTLSETPIVSAWDHEFHEEWP